MKLLECDCLSCMCTLVGSNPGRKLSLLSFAHPVEGSPFQVQGAIGKAALTRDRMLEESRLVALILLYTCIKILRFNICCIRVIY